MFAKLNQAYGVLNDPHKRALYDCLGKDGISPDVLAVIPRTKTPKEIRDEYERLAKGQLISKCLYGVIVWTKTPTKFFPGFLP